jgi:adenosylcobinamide-GDP ribazoletransferase
MKKTIIAFFMAWGMFSAIPCPYKRWDNSLRPLMVSLLPLIGLLLGAVWLLVAYLLRLLGLNGLLGAAVLTALPFLLTGFIHLDGYMDCCDAIMSRRDLPERQRILKDSHTGAYAVICLVLMVLLSFSLFASWDYNNLLPLLFIPVVSRSVSSLAVNMLKPMGHSSYSGAYSESKKLGGSVFPLLALLLSCALCLVFGSLAAVGTLIGSVLAVWYADRQLGGMSGDVSGYGITSGEACGVLVMVIEGFIW